MRTTKNVMTKLAAALLFAGVPIGASAEDWSWSIAPYAWLPAIGSNLDIDVPPIDTGGTSQFSGWSPKLGFTIPLHLEGQGDEIGILSDILYLPLSNDRSGRFFGTDTDLKAGVFELAAVWSPGPVRHEGFEVIGGLLSRAAVYVLEPLDAEDLAELFRRAVAAAMPDVAIDDVARDALIAYADGDGRRLINMVEQLAIAVGDAGRSSVDMAFVEQTIARSLRRFDKGGEAFYDQISALHKAVRGSDPDASLYWFMRMLDGGADPLYCGRRLIRMASEDIGLADPRALEIALAAVQAFERLGSPEGELALAQCVLYLAVAPKSNAAYMAFGAARSFIKEDGSRPVPLRLRNAPTRLMKQLDYGKGYRYAHDEEDAYAAGDRYLPDGMPDTRFYEPTDHGVEKRIQDRLSELRARDAKARGEGPKS